MTEQKIERIQVDRDKQGNMTEIFLFNQPTPPPQQNEKVPLSPRASPTPAQPPKKYFLRKHFQTNPKFYPPLKTLTTATRSPSLQEAVLGQLKGPFLSITFEFDYCSIDNEIFKASLTEERIVTLLLELTRVGAFLEENLTYYNSFSAAMINLFADAEGKARIRLTHPLAVEDYLNEWLENVLPSLEELQTRGVTLKEINELMNAEKLLDPKEEESIFLIQKLKDTVLRKSKAALFMMVFTLFCLKSGNSSNYYSQSEESFLHRVNEDLVTIHLSPDLKEFFALVLNQTFFDIVPSFSGFINKLITQKWPVRNEYEERLLIVVGRIIRKAKPTLELLVRSIPNHESKRLELAELSGDNHLGTDFSFGPYPKKKQEAIQPLPVSNPPRIPAQQTDTISNVFNSGITPKTPHVPPTRNVVVPVFGRHSVKDYGPEAVVSEEKIYGIKVRRISPSPNSTPSKENLSQRNSLMNYSAKPSLMTTQRPNEPLIRQNFEKKQPETKTQYEQEQLFPSNYQPAIQTAPNLPTSFSEKKLPTVTYQNYYNSGRNVYQSNSSELPQAKMVVQESNMSNEPVQLNSNPGSFAQPYGSATSLQEPSSSIVRNSGSNVYSSNVENQSVVSDSSQRESNTSEGGNDPSGKRKSSMKKNKSPYPSKKSVKFSDE